MTRRKEKILGGFENKSSAWEEANKNVHKVGPLSFSRSKWLHTALRGITWILARGSKRIHVAPKDPWAPSRSSQRIHVAPSGFKVAPRSAFVVAPHGCTELLLASRGSTSFHRVPRDFKGIRVAPGAPRDFTWIHVVPQSSSWLQGDPRGSRSSAWLHVDLHIIPKGSTRPAVAPHGYVAKYESSRLWKLRRLHVTHEGKGQTPFHAWLLVTLLGAQFRRIPWLKWETYYALCYHGLFTACEGGRKRGEFLGKKLTITGFWFLFYFKTVYNKCSPLSYLYCVVK